MKKSLIALAVLAASGAAMAQSTVTLFGIVDAAYAKVSAGGTSKTGITNSGINSSRFGMKGSEDLGGGMKAEFWLEGALSNDDGNAAGLNFQRRSTVSLVGAMGEIRVGRDYTPSFWNTTVYDAFGTNGVGQALTPGMIGFTGAASNSTAFNSAAAVRSNNSISWFTPVVGGFNAQVMRAFGEGVSSVKTNDYFGYRLGYTQGALAANFAGGTTQGATDAADTKYSNMGVAYDLGVAKLIAFKGSEKAGALKISATEFSTVIPVSTGEVRLATSKYDVANSANDFRKTAVGYVHNLSKRTALYSTYARVANSGAAVASVQNNGLTQIVSPGLGASAAGGSSTGYEFGVRHSF
jgi:predicted porin